MSQLYGSIIIEQLNGWGGIRVAKRIYLGATRRQRSRAMQNLGITVSILVVFFLLCAFFAAWLMANEGKLTLDPPQDTQAPQAESIQTERTEPPVTSYLPDTEPVSQMPELPLSDVLISGIPTKMLDYTDTWVVMLDAGHGFDDIGASSALLGDTNEAQINLDIVLRMKAMLEDAGIVVLMTHDTNAVEGRVSASLGGEMPLRDLVLLQPDDRAALANTQDIDLYVSLHCDSIPTNPDASGMRMYFHKNSEFSGVRNAAAEALAAYLSVGFDAVIDGKTPLIKEKSDDEAYYVIKYVTAPSVLCEIGFITNAEDASSMLDPAWREDVARGLCDGISYYIATADALRHS